MCKFLKVICSAPLLIPTYAGAATVEERLETLEEKQAALERFLEEKGNGSAGPDRVTLSGLLEVQGVYESSKGSDGTVSRSGDLVLSTVQLGLNAELNENFAGRVVLLDDSEQGLEVDEATLDFTKDRFTARLGRMYLPFGVYPSSFAEDPLTLLLGETRETALESGVCAGSLRGKAFVFRGHSGDSWDWGAALALSPAEGLELGGSFLSDLSDSDAGLLSSSDYARRVPGWSAYILAGIGPVTGSAEMLGAAGAFASSDMDADADGEGDRPLAWNTELTWAATADLALSARLGGSAQWAEHPNLQYGAGLLYRLWDELKISVECLREEYDERFSSIRNRLLGVVQVSAGF